MYKNKAIAAVIPVFNEETRIGRVIETLPDFIDKIVIIDDKSTDSSRHIIRNYRNSHPHIVLLEHPINQGSGAAVATGYKWIRDNGYDVAIRLDGDGQMDPANLKALIEPVVEEKVDYAKGNRFFTREVYQKYPKLRYYGNAVLSLLTKIASGYWQIADSQSGYTAINKKALETIDWDLIYKDYGHPNDILVMLNIYDFRVKDVMVQPVYGVGENSKLKIYKVLYKLSWLLVKRFFWRLKEKYIIRDFHPLIFFYAFGFLFGIATVLLSARIFYFWIILGEQIPKVNALAAMFSFMSSTQFTLFAMWFDSEASKNGSNYS